MALCRGAEVAIARLAPYHEPTYPCRYATALATCLPLGHLPRLAAAAKHRQRSVHVAVYELQPTPRGVSLPLLAHIDVPCADMVESMAWAGDQLVVCTTTCEYLLLAPLVARPGWRDLAAAAPGGDEGPARLPALVHAVPQANAALLLVGQAGVLVDAAGSPVGSALRLEGLIGTLAVAASGTHVVVAAGCRVHVYDVHTGSEMQHLTLGNSPSAAAGGWPLVAGDSPSGSYVALASGRSVWLCLPVSLEDQVRELLARHEYAGALEAMELAFRQGAPWAETACAQAALLLLQGGRCAA